MVFERPPVVGDLLSLDNRRFQLRVDLIIASSA